jgi:hypothetical protein
LDGFSLKIITTITSHTTLQVESSIFLLRIDAVVINSNNQLNTRPACERKDYCLTDVFLMTPLCLQRKKLFESSPLHPAFASRVAAEAKSADRQIKLSNVDFGELMDG